MTTRSLVNFCQQFHDDPSRNPRTRRIIKIGGPTYNKFVRLCGEPPQLFDHLKFNFPEFNSPVFNQQFR